MTRLVTRLNSPELLPFFFNFTTPLSLPLRRNPNTSIQFSPPKSRKITVSATASNGRKPHASLLAMDPLAPEPEPEDFVHIENPSVDSLSESIVKVDGPQVNDDDGGVSTSNDNDGGVSTSNDNDGGVSTSNDNEAADNSDQRRGVLLPQELLRMFLPQEVLRNVVTLTCESTAEGGICEVFLVGTAHVSQESCTEVQAVISLLKPQVVFLELCSSRVAVLTPQNIKVPTTGEMIEMWKKKHNIFGILYSWFLAKVASKLEVFPGAEFRVAYEEAMKYGARVILGDRPVQITIRRTWAKMPLWHKIKLLFSLLFQAVFLPSPEDLNRMLKEMDDVDMLTLVIQEMSKEFPTLMESLVHERDQYMSSTLLKIASEHSSVVAVVGKGHLQGIKKHWKQPVEVKDLMSIPSQKPAISAVKIFTSLGVAVAGVAIISGVYLASKK